MANPEGRVNYMHVSDVPNTLTQRMTYNGDGTIEYLGHAKQGTGESDNGWSIQFFDYTSQQVTSITIAQGTWSGRASLSYA